MFTLRSSVTSPLSAPICLLPATQREEERGCTPTREHLLLSEPVNTVFKNKKERAVDRKVVREVCSCRDAAVTAQQLAAYASSPVVRVSSSSYPTAPVSDPLCVLCPIIHASYICGVCSTPHPSSTFSVITLCVSDVSCVSLCQALATGAPSQPLRVTVTPPELSLASCYIGKRRRWLLTASPADRVENRNVFLGFSVFLFCFFTTSFTRQCCV